MPERICIVKACGGKHHAKGLCCKHYHQRPERKAYTKAYHQRPEVKAHVKAYQKTYYQRPEVKAYYQARYPQKYAANDFRAKQREYQKLLCRYEEKDGDIPRRDVLRLEALSEILGRDLEEWRVGADRVRHINMLETRRNELKED